MTYRLVAIDLDDTLLNDQLQVTTATREALTEAIARGVHITIATGRMFASAQQIARQIGLNVPIITYQGSLIKNLIDGNVLYERSVPPEASLKLYEFCTARGFHLQTYIDDKLHTPSDNDRIKAYAKESNIPYTVVPDFEKLVASGAKQTKMLMIDEPAKLDAIIDELRELLGPDVHVTKSKAHYLEFMHREGTKGHALRFLANHYDIPMEETIAMGDAWNDREMIEAAGLGIAMENGVPGLKALAGYITRSNNDEGVRHAIEKFILS